MKLLLNFSIIRFSIILFTLLVFVSCGDGPVQKLIEFKTNSAPQILSFSSNAPGGASLQPNQSFQIEVKATDADGQKISFEFSGNIGSFSGEQVDGDNASVTFILPGVISGGFQAIVNVTVTDTKGAASRQSLNIGSGILGPSLTLQNTLTQILRSTVAINTETINWSANANGFYQVFVFPNITTTCQSDLSKPFLFYSAETVIATKINGSGVAPDPNAYFFTCWQW